MLRLSSALKECDLFKTHQFSRFTNDEDYLVCFHHIDELPPEERLANKQELLRLEEVDISVFTSFSFYTFIQNKSQCKLICDKCFRSVYFDPDIMDIRNFSDLLFVLFSHRLLLNNSLFVHAAAVIHNSEGILFCGFSGAGKSTHANLWERYLGAVILNFDKPIISQKAGRHYVSGSSWSGKESVYINRTVPLKAICFIEQSKTNSCRKLSKAEAYAKVYANYLLHYINDAYSALYEEHLDNLVRSIPIYELSCDISKEAVRTAYGCINESEGFDRIMEKQVWYVVPDSYIMRNIADEFIVIARGKEAVNFRASIVLNDTGALLFSKLKKKACSLEQLAHEFVIQYSISEEEAIRDVKAYLDGLIAEGIVHVVDEVSAHV